MRQRIYANIYKIEVFFATNYVFFNQNVEQIAIFTLNIHLFLKI